jgi:hypothetical protein
MIVGTGFANARHAIAVGTMLAKNAIYMPVIYTR